MSIFGNILKKIFHPKQAQAQTQTEGNTGGGGFIGGNESPTATKVDVGAVLDEMAKTKGEENLNYRTSIVDLLKLLDMDSGLSARKELAAELGVNAGEAGSAEQNVALQKAVMQKLEENGGVVPASLRD